MDPRTPSRSHITLHALDLMADIFELKKDTAQACKCWDRLKDKWDPIRAGYWDYRRNAVEAA